MRLQISISIFLIFSFLNISFSHSSVFTCSNTADWKTMASNSTPYDFYKQKIKPDGSPNKKLSNTEIFNAVYKPEVAEFDFNPDSECYAEISCIESDSNPTGYDFSKSFSSSHPAWKDSRCYCSHFPQTGCNRVSAYRKGHPELVSGGVGTPLPIYPDPTFPASWSEQYIYSHNFATDTSDATIELNIGANRDTAYGTNTTTTKCSEDSTTIDGQELNQKYYLVSGLKNFDQSVIDLYDEKKVIYEENWGHCGGVKQYWTDSPKLNKPWPSIGRAIPVIAYVPASSSDDDDDNSDDDDSNDDSNDDSKYEYSDRAKCDSGYSYNSAGKHCVKNAPISDNKCPAGYSRIPGGFGYGASCRKIVSVSLQSCPSGWEVNPSNTNQCRKKKVVSPPPATKPPVTKPPVTKPPPATKPPVTKPPKLVSGSGVGVGSGSSTVPPWCTGKGYVWNSSTKTCHAPDGGGIVTPTPGNSNSPTLVTFGKAPVAGNKTGTRDISAHGFYKSIYGLDTKLSTFMEAEIAKWDTETLKKRLMKFVPASGPEALPKICIDLTFLDEEFCIDFNVYAVGFNMLRSFFYIIAGWTAFRIVLGD